MTVSPPRAVSSPTPAMRSPSTRTDTRRAGEPEPSMMFAFVMRKPALAGAGAELFGAQAVAIAMTVTDAAISLRCMEDVARYAFADFRTGQILRVGPCRRKA